MQFSIKRILIKKRTQKQAERAYRSRIAAREAKKRELHWQSIATQSHFY